MYVFTDASTNQTDGTSGVGFVVKNDACKRIYSGSQALMCANNNSAELWAIAYCCQLLSEAGFFKSKQDVHFFVDSKTALKSLQNSNPADDLSLEALQHIETYLFHRGADNHIGRISFYQTCGHYRCTVPFIAKGNHEADRLAAKARKELELFLTHKKGPVVSFDMKEKHPKGEPYYVLENPLVRPQPPTKICSFHSVQDVFTQITQQQQPTLQNCF